MPRPANLNAMSVDKLIALRSQIEATLSGKVAQERRSLEAQLNALSRVNSSKSKGGGASLRGGGALRGTSIAPKYRNPEDPSETWAGRGLKPRWLTAALKKGKKTGALRHRGLRKDRGGQNDGRQGAQGQEIARARSATRLSPPQRRDFIF